MDVTLTRTARSMDDAPAKCRERLKKRKQASETQRKDNDKQHSLWNENDFPVI